MTTDAEEAAADPSFDAYYDDDDDGECEIEELRDDLPMRIADGLFLGSIDAAHNAPALTHHAISVALGLLGHGEGESLPVVTPSTIRRVRVELEDAADEDLFGQLPALVERLEGLRHEAKREGGNVLVHCLAGRSRSPALLAAWLMLHRRQTLDEALAHITDIRPWIQPNPRFLLDLRLLERVTTATPSSTDDLPSVLRGRELPRLDFGPTLVADILAHAKRVTMRLASDTETDAHSDLGRIHPHSTCVATTAPAAGDDGGGRRPFAFLQVQELERGVPLKDVRPETLAKTGQPSADAVLAVLRTFYDDVTMDTPLVIVHFTCVGDIGAPRAQDTIRHLSALGN